MRKTVCTLVMFFSAFVATNLFAQGGSLTEEQLTKLVEGDLKVASQTLKEEIEKHPTDAELHKVAGDVYAVRAQGASLFSAPGLAKRCVKSYEKAVELAPENTRYRTSLAQFYSFAPGIVGGSKKKAKQQVEAIEKIDPVSGVVVRSFYLLGEDDQTGLAALFEGVDEDLASHPRVRLAKANWLRSQKEFEQAIALTQGLMDISVEPDANVLDRLLPYNAMLQVGFIGNGSDNDAHRRASIAAFERYLAEAPETYRLTSKKWVRLFLGQAHAKSGDKKKAESILLEAKQLASDESLLEQIDKALEELAS